MLCRKLQSVPGFLATIIGLVIVTKIINYFYHHYYCCIFNYMKFQKKNNSSILTKVNFLPLHPKNKIAVYNRYLLSKLSWHFTAASLPKTLVCEHLDNVVAQYIRKWLELPISAMLSSIILPQNKFGLNTQPSFHCQTVLQNALKNSQNEEIKKLWKSTLNHTNIQYDVYRNTKEALKAIQNKHEDRLKNHLISQGSLFSNMAETSLSSVNFVWSLAQRNLPKNIFNFTIRYINSSLPTRKILLNGACHPLLIVHSVYSLKVSSMLFQVAKPT